MSRELERLKTSHTCTTRKQEKDIITWVELFKQADAEIKANLEEKIKATYKTAILVKSKNVLKKSNDWLHVTKLLQRT